MSKILEAIRQEQLKKDAAPEFSVGDSVRVHVKIKEGDKERVQVFAGTVIARDGRGATETFTVRRISYGEGVERIFPICSPSVTKVEVEKSSRVRRAKLYYLRSRTGKATKLDDEVEPDAKPVAAAAKA
ncbi:MAG: 50S ribosomal protein L19 [Verrucomicrobia bacterium]|nr:MAG: 50S ribosomal protein L19 [Verrucomicrobiota bacterium]